MFVHNWTKKVAEAAKLAGRLFVPQVTFCTSSKVKVTRLLCAVHLQGTGHIVAAPLQAAQLDHVHVISRDNRQM